MGSKYQGGKKIRRGGCKEKSYRIQGSGSRSADNLYELGSGRKEKAAGGKGGCLEERGENGALREWFSQGGQFIQSQVYLQIYPVTKG